MIKVYGNPLSVYVRKVLLLIEEKGLLCELVPVTPHSDDPAFKLASPFGKIPAIDDGGFLLSDSSAIAWYLDSRVVAPALIPVEPRARGRVVWFEEISDTILAPAANPIVHNRFLKPKLFGTHGDENVAIAASIAVNQILEQIERQISVDNYLVDTFSLADLAIGSVFKTLSYTGFEIAEDNYPKLHNWYERLTARAAWKAVEHREAQFCEENRIPIWR